MSIIQILGEKPWLDKSTSDEIAMFDISRSKNIALNFFLAIVSVLFSLFIVTFLARSQFPDFTPLATDTWQPFYEPTRLWVNTGILFVSGFFIQLAFSALKKSKIELAMWAVVLSFFFALQFLVAQLLLWQHLQQLGFYVSNNPANSYFYVFTAVHGVHLLGGVCVLGVALFSFWRGRASERLALSVQLCTKYWHYLFALWLVLFALMTSSPETYKTLAALCGY